MGIYTGPEQRTAADTPAGQQQAPPDTPAGRPADSTGQAPGRPATWHRVADLYPTLGADPKTVRRWIARHVPHDAQERREPAGGGSPELYLRDDQLPALQATYGTGQAPGATPDRPAGTPGEQQARPADSTGQAPGVPADLVAGWREALARADAENDRLRSQLAALDVARQAAEQRAAEAERGRWSAEARHEALRSSVWRWLALCRRPLWRLRPMPEPPPELGQSDRLLTTTG